MLKKEIEQRVLAQHGDSISYLGKNSPCYVKGEFKCKNCGREWHAKICSVYGGAGCSNCSSKLKNRSTDEKYRQKLWNFLGDSLIPLEPYLGHDIPILHICKKSGHETKLAPIFIWKGRGCVTCGMAARYEKTRKSEETYLEEIFDLYGDKFRPIEKYISTRTAIQHQCSEGHLVSKKPCKVLEGRWCKICSRKEWREERLTNGYYPESFKYKDYDLDGSVLRVQGYEPFALDILRRTFSKDEIRVGKDVPRISYVLNGIDRLHYPDIYVPSKNLIIEVKSKWTMGAGSEQWFSMLREKLKAALSLGFRYEVWLFSDDGKQLFLDLSWYNFTYSEFLQHLTLI